MPVKCQTIINYIEKLAPKSLAEEWDNVGLQIGDPTADIDKVLITLDITEEVVKEAINSGTQMIVSHHPLFFKPLKNLRFDNAFGKLVRSLVKNDINVFAAHTNLDSAMDGVNQVLARKINLSEVQVLHPDKVTDLVKLVVFVPVGHQDKVREAIAKEGAGFIGNYSDCTFQTEGIGTFKGMEGTNPHIGTPGKLEKVEEVRIETILPATLQNRIIKAMLKAHPYEEAAFDLYPVLNKGIALGIGRIGVLPEELPLSSVVELVKKQLDIANTRVVGDLAAKIRKVAVCGGSGGSFIQKAHFLGADLLVTGDIKHHEALDAKALGLNIIDAGHHATEAIVLNTVADYLKSMLKSDDTMVCVSAVKTEPFIFI